MLTALGQFLLDIASVTFVLHALAEGSHPGHGVRPWSESSAPVLESSGSRYGPSAPPADIDHALDRGEPFVFVGKPCDIRALRNLALFDSRVDEPVHYWLTRDCGGYMAPLSLARLIRERFAADPADVVAIRYRGMGRCPGRTVFTLKDGRERTFRYTDFWGTDDSQWSLRFRCNICPDDIGEGADVTAADCWPGGAPDP